MYKDYLPDALHQQADAFIQALATHVETERSFKRLLPHQSLLDIARQRLTGRSCLSLAQELELSVRAVKRRDKAIMQWMNNDYPELYQWVAEHTELTVHPTIIIQQHTGFKAWLQSLLTLTQANCPYCQSNNTIRIGQRLNFRCPACRRTFDKLKYYRLNRLSHHELWLPFVDHLMAGETNKDITRALGINVTTVAKWRNSFLYLMKQQGFDPLADWIIQQRHYRYYLTYQAVQAGNTFLPRAGSKFKPKWH